MLNSEVEKAMLSILIDNSCLSIIIFSQVSHSGYQLLGGILGIISLFFRQTNVVWIAYIIGVRTLLIYSKWI